MKLQLVKRLYMYMHKLTKGEINKKTHREKATQKTAVYIKKKKKQKKNTLIILLRAENIN